MLHVPCHLISLCRTSSERRPAPLAGDATPRYRFRRELLLLRLCSSHRLGKESKQTAVGGVRAVKLHHLCLRGHPSV